MIRQGLAYGIRNPLTKGCAKAFRNPSGNPSLQGPTISGSGHRCSYRQSRIHEHDDHVRFFVRWYRRIRSGTRKSWNEMRLASGAR